MCSLFITVGILLSAPIRCDGTVVAKHDVGIRSIEIRNHIIVAQNDLKIYDSQGNFKGNLNNNQYDPNSVANPYGQYGNPYNPKSINNPYNPSNPNNPYGGNGTIDPNGTELK